MNILREVLPFPPKDVRMQIPGLGEGWGAEEKNMKGIHE